MAGAVIGGTITASSTLTFESPGCGGRGVIEAAPLRAHWSNPPTVIDT
jgi:hypothetical protein